MVPMLRGVGHRAADETAAGRRRGLPGVSQQTFLDDWTGWTEKQARIFSGQELRAKGIGVAHPAGTARSGHATRRIVLGAAGQAPL